MLLTRQCIAAYDLEFTINADGSQLAASLAINDLPKAGQRLPLILILPGAQLWDRNGNVRRGVPYNHYRDISDALVTKGFAICRYDKRGVGESTGSVAFDTKSLAADARVVLYELMKRNDIDAQRVILIGHSQGAGIITQMIISDRFLRPLGIALLAPAADAQEIISVIKSPVFIGHGEFDREIAPPIIEQVTKGLKDKGLPVTAVQIPGGSHLLFDISKGEPSYENQEVTVSPFLLEQLSSWAASLIGK